MSDKHKDYLRIIGENLRTVRQAKGLTLQDLAGRCKINSDEISRIENAEEDCMLSTLIALSKALGISLREITSEDKEGLPGTR